MNDEDMDEDEFVKRDIVREIEETFANVPYPGDDNLLRFPDYASKSVLATFRGKHWSEITPEMLIEHQHSLHLFSPEAFWFFLPCFLISAIRHGDVTDLLWETVFYNLAPGFGGDTDFLNERISLLDARQKKVLRRYVELFVRIETSVPDPRNGQAVEFWRRITESAKPN